MSLIQNLQQPNPQIVLHYESPEGGHEHLEQLSPAAAAPPDDEPKMARKFKGHAAINNNNNNNNSSANKNTRLDGFSWDLSF